MSAVGAKRTVDFVGGREDGSEALPVRAKPLSLFQSERSMAIGAWPWLVDTRVRNDPASKKLIELA
jgi:hypothetical protein